MTSLGKTKLNVFCGHDLYKCLNAMKYVEHEKLISKQYFMYP